MSKIRVQDKSHLLKCSPRLLYEFYQHQSSRKLGSVHATYLVSGTQARIGEYNSIGVGQSDFGVANLQSSPFMNSSIPPGDDAEEQPSVKVIALVREQDLEGKICMRDIVILFSSYERPMLPVMEH